MKLNHSQESFLFVLGKSRLCEGLWKLKRGLPRGRFLLYWVDGEDEDEIAYDMWIHVFPFSSEALKMMSDAAAADSVRLLLTDESCAWALGPYDGGTDVLQVDDDDRARLRALYADWLPLPEHPYGA